MAVDTANKRFSMMGLGMPHVLEVKPSGSVDAATRSTLLNLYEGITLDDSAIWTPQANDGSSWSAQSLDGSTWTPQADDSSVWS
jgi:hypothetical protein